MSMSLLEELAFQFEDLNVVMEENVLAKCGEICLTYSMSPEDFYDNWLAYSASTGSELTPTMKELIKVEQWIKNEVSVETASKKCTRKGVRVGSQMSPKTPVQKNLQHGIITDSLITENKDIPSKNFKNRLDSGTTVLEFGNKCESFKDCSNQTLNIKIVNSEIEESFYMYEKPLSRCNSLDTMTRLVAADILDHHKLQLSEEKFKKYAGEVVVCGRIICEGTEKSKYKSILLEGLVDFHGGHRVHLSLNRVEKVKLFPGQAVVVAGESYQNWFTANQIFTEAPITCKETPDLKETVRILTAAGPFTLHESLLYEPLEELLRQVREYKPNILLLMGPFLDSRHPSFDNSTEFYETFFESIIQGIMQQLDDIKVQVVLVPSHKDIHIEHIFPTIPYKLKKHYENLYLAPDPFFLDIDGLLIGGSTADVIVHLGKSEISRGACDDKIAQLLTHIFNQRCLYPLHPSDDNIIVDYQRVEQHATFETAPHLMILPSSLKYFVKVIENCVVVNPQRLSKGNSGGTFAKIEIRAEPKDTTISERVTCTIQKL